MKKEMKPFIHLITKMYVKYGVDRYPICTQQQEDINVSDIIGYTTGHILQLQTYYGQQRQQRERSGV